MNCLLFPSFSLTMHGSWAENKAHVLLLLTEQGFILYSNIASVWSFLATMLYYRSHVLNHASLDVLPDLDLLGCPISASEAATCGLLSVKQWTTDQRIWEGHTEKSNEHRHTNTTPSLPVSFVTVQDPFTKGSSFGQISFSELDWSTMVGSVETSPLDSQEVFLTCMAYENLHVDHMAVSSSRVKALSAMESESALRRWAYGYRRPWSQLSDVNFQVPKNPKRTKWNMKRDRSPNWSPLYVNQRRCWWGKALRLMRN